MDSVNEELNQYDPRLKWMHPDAKLKGIIKLILRIGAKKFLEGAGLNKEREGFLSCLFAYALRKRTKKEYFLQQEEDPPDFSMIAPSDRPFKEKPFDNFNVEIVEIPILVKDKEDKLQFSIDLIKNKKLDEYYLQEGTFLLIFINSDSASGLATGIAEFVQNNQNLFKRYGEVYILFITSFNAREVMGFTLVNVIKKWDVLLSLKEEFNKGILFKHPVFERVKSFS